MKLLLSVILILISSVNIHSQVLTDSLLTSFFNQTLNDYFEQPHTAQSEYYILKDSIPNDIKTDFDNFKLYPLSYKEAYPLIKKGKMTEFYWAKPNRISKDTVDIVIGNWSVSFKRVLQVKKFDGRWKLIRSNYHFASNSGGTMGYIPEGRFVYDHKSSVWKYLTEEFVINEEMKKYNNAGQ